MGKGKKRMSEIIGQAIGSVIGLILLIKIIDCCITVKWEEEENEHTKKD